MWCSTEAITVQNVFYSPMCGYTESMTPQCKPMDVLASRECFLPGPHNSVDVYGLITKTVTASRKPGDGGVLVPGDRAFTWVPEKCVFVTLIKLDNGMTAVYSHLHDRMFFASPRAMMGHGIPVGTSLLAMYIEDGLHSKDIIPWLLVFDVLAVKWKRLDGVPACDRYEMLRSRFGNLCAPEDQGLGKSLLRLHWVGNFVCANNILDGSMNLPHSVESFALLRDDTPGVIEVMSTDAIDRRRE